MAKYKKKRARELKHDKFRDTTMGLVDRASHGMEGKGRKILYALGALVAAGLIIWGVTAWRGSKAAEESHALGRAIKVMETTVVAEPVPGSTTPSFRTEKERAQKAVEEFQKVAQTYGGSTGERARYFAATQQLLLDRAKGASELEALTKSSDADVSALAKFALGQAKEGDGKYEEAAALYGDLVETERHDHHARHGQPAPGNRLFKARQEAGGRRHSLQDRRDGAPGQRQGRQARAPVGRRAHGRAGVGKGRPGPLRPTDAASPAGQSTNVKQNTGVRIQESGVRSRNKNRSQKVKLKRLFFSPDS